MRSLQKHSKKFLSILSVLTLMLTMVCSLGVSAEDTETQTNLITADSDVRMMKVPVPDGKIWDDNYDYGTLEFYSALGGTYAQNLSDGDKANNAYVYPINSGITVDGTAVTEVLRRAVWVDLGAIYNLSDINLYSASKKRSIYDFSVYGALTVSYSSTESDWNAKLAANEVLQTGTKLGHYKVDEVSKESYLELQSGSYARYLVIVLNKIYSDYGNANDETYGGLLGDKRLAGTVTTDGNTNSFALTELEVFGTPAVNIMTADNVNAGKQSAKAYTYTNWYDGELNTYDNIPLWNLNWADGDFDGYYSATANALNIATNYQTWFDGDTTTFGTNEMGSQGASSETNWDVTIARRVGVLLDLGQDYAANAVELSVRGTAYSLFDYSVFGASDMEGPDNILSADHFLANATSSTLGTSFFKSFNNADRVRYVLIVFNKLGNDPGNYSHTASKDATTGEYRYGTPLATQNAATWCNGSPNLTEVKVFGTPFGELDTLVSTDGITAGEQDIRIYSVDNPNYATHWTNTYPYTYGAVTAGPALKNRLHFVDGDTTVTVANNGGYAGVGTGGLTTASEEKRIAAATAIMSTRTAMMIDLGKVSSPEYLAMNIPSNANSVYDCSVYGGATVAEATALAEENLVGRYVSDKQTKKAVVTLDATDVQYLFVVFNKVGSDPGNTNDKGSTGYGFDDAGTALFGETTLPGSTYPSGGFFATEVNVYGVKDEEVSAAPESAGATVLVDPTNGYDMMVVSNLPADLTASEGYTLKEYGTLVIPYQYLPLGSNAKAGAALVYGNQYVATAAIDATEVAPVAGAALNVELSNSATVYPGVKFSCRTYLLYEDAEGNQEIVYGNIVTRSVWSVARTIATKVLEAKEAGTLKTTLTYTEKVTDAYTAALAAVATSSTDVTYADLYDFISKNVDAVAEIA